jgi:hypothetical protein
MDEYIEIRFQKKGKRLRVKRQVPGGIEFDEPDPLERTVGIGFDARSAATRERMNSIRRIQGWEPGVFKLKVSVEDGSIILRGVNEHALPEGVYKIRLQVEEAKTLGGFQTADVDHDGHAVLDVAVEMDNRSVAVDLDDCDQEIRDVLGRSTVDGVAAIEWLEDTDRRPTRQACLLNLLASLRTRPASGAPLLRLVHDVFVVGNDRVYAKVDRSLLDTIQALVLHPTMPFYAEGQPNAPIHGRLLSALPEPLDVRARFKDLFSFRGEGKPSLQVVIAVPPPELPHTYAEFDLDLGNPLQDVLGLIVHVGELLDGKPTNHLDMRKVLAKTRASEFLHYAINTG